VIHDHREDKEPAQQINPQVAAVLVNVTGVRAVLEGRRWPRPAARGQHDIVMAFRDVMLFG
jgi:hypothetical protein